MLKPAIFNDSMCCERSPKKHDYSHTGKVFVSVFFL